MSTLSLLTRKMGLRLATYKTNVNKIYYERVNNYDEMLKKENVKIAEFGFNIYEAEKKLNSILQGMFRRKFDRRNDSVHWLIFSALSLTTDRFDSILEIGTANGKFTKILANLYQESKITTIDLPDDDPFLRSIYNRDNDSIFSVFKKEQNRNLQSPNIDFIQINSFFLPERIKEKFDLIWVDGGHLYPEIAWDLCNAYHLCKKNGYILCDDIIINQKKVRTSYVSNDSYDVIWYIAKRAEIKCGFFLKRMDAKWNCNSVNRKYVACMKKHKIPKEKSAR